MTLPVPLEIEPLDWVDITIDESDGRICLSFDDGTYVRTLDLAQAVGLLMYLHQAIARMPAPSVKVYD
jgi:hypothetical protein